MTTPFNDRRPAPTGKRVTLRKVPAEWGDARHEVHLDGQHIGHVESAVESVDISRQGAMLGTFRDRKQHYPEPAIPHYANGRHASFPASSSRKEAVLDVVAHHLAHQEVAHGRPWDHNAARNRARGWV